MRQDNAGLNLKSHVERYSLFGKDKLLRTVKRTNYNPRNLDNVCLDRKYLIIARCTPNFTAASCVSAVKTRLGEALLEGGHDVPDREQEGSRAGFSGWK